MKKGNFIVSAYERVIFYTGDLHEISELNLKPDKLDFSFAEVFNTDIEALLLQENTSGYFDFKHDKYIYKNKRIKSLEKLMFIELEGETDENISFYTMLIHEIRNPLAAIRTLVEALSVDIIDDLQKVSQDSCESAKEYFTRITAEIDRLNRLLMSVKYISKHIHSLYVTFDLVKVANNTLKIFSNILKEKGIELVRNYSDESILFYGDSDQFHQIFNNLITNAVEAIKNKRGRIIINITENKDDSIKIEVIDEGIGIEKTDLGNIFKAFYTKKIGGMGIGLSVVRMIVKNYKGKLDINSNIGKGTKVTIDLPKNNQEAFNEK